GTTFHYSDINFIILGALVEKVTGQTLDIYVQDSIFAPLGMNETRYLPAAKACGPHHIVGTAITLEEDPRAAPDCAAGTWSTSLLTRIAPTAHDGDAPAVLGALIEIASTAWGATSDTLPEYLVFGAISIATLGWLWGVGDTYVAELFPTVLRGTGFGIAVGGGRVVSIAAPALVGWAITHYGIQTPYLALSGLWILTIIGYLLGPETKGKELEDLADEALTEDLPA
ncbi:sugar (and other) transporter family protein, partial [Mycobacteroides abscessus MAB_082312_2272]